MSKIDKASVHRAAGRLQNKDCTHGDDEHQRLLETIERIAKEWVKTFDAISDPIVLLEPGGIVRRCNQAFSVLVAKPYQEIVNRPCELLGDAKQGGLCLSKVRREKKSLQTETEIAGRHFVITFDPILDDHGRILDLVLALKDISERKQTEEALRERDQLLQNLSAQIPGMIYTLKRKADGAYSIPYCSNVIRDLFGILPKDVVGDASPMFKAILAADCQRVMASIEQSAQAMTTWHCEYRVQVQGQPLRWIWSQAEPFRLPDGSILWYGFNAEITERKRAEEQIHESLREKEVLLQEIHHRVKNNLQIVSALLTMQLDQAGDRKVDEIFSNSQDRIRTIALVHEKLYRSHSLSEIAFDEYVSALTNDLLYSHGVAADRITVKFEMESVLFSIEKAVPLGLIINELVTNALKHAFPEGRRGEIRIELRGRKMARFIGAKTESGKLSYVSHCEVIVADNGVGLPEDFACRENKSMGMTLVEMLAKQLNATLQIKTAPGTEFRFQIPMPLPANKGRTMK